MNEPLLRWTCQERGKSSGLAAGCRALVIVSAAVAANAGGCKESYRAPTNPNTAAPKTSAAVALQSRGSAGYLAVLEDTAAIPSASRIAPVSPSQAKSGADAPPTSALKDPKFCSAEDGAKWIAIKARYSPPGNVYPQIIQGDEYGTIEAIQTLYAQASGTTMFGTMGIQGHQEGKSDASKIMLTGSGEPVTVDVSEKSTRIGRRAFPDPRTASLFRTLGRLLADLGAECTHQGVRGSRLRSRAYKDNIRVEFSYGPVIVTLDALSNGPANPERLYVLDIMEPKDSLLWVNEQPLKPSIP